MEFTCNGILDSDIEKRMIDLSKDADTRSQIINLNKEGIPFSKIVESLDITIEVVLMVIFRLTHRQAEVYNHTVHGFTPDEIGDFLGISKETVRKIICNIKLKLKLQKSAELTAYYWCKYFGSSLESQRNQLLASVFAIIIIVSIPLEIDKNRFRIRGRRQEVEIIYN